MSYTKTTWVNNVTPINETNMNNIENGIVENEKAINEIVAIPESELDTILN